ncbi:MAG: flavin oxidoreductase/NADH oxidase [Clostridia bacterium]|nr:flavin oxidoreductase/NADH oxidase [Clostridia bacterium]
MTDTILNTPIDLCGRTLPNRIVFQPMEGCDGTLKGAPDELTSRRYLRFACSGAGIIWFEATAVTAEGRANPRQLYINAETVGDFKELVGKIKITALEKCGFEPLVIVQLTHSGRFSKPNGTPEPIVAYRNELWEKGKENQPYTVADDAYLASVTQSYAAAAQLAMDAGFDGIDVKCCHGYLFNELLSAKKRSGIYGGSFENRTKLFFDCIDAVKKVLGDKLIVTTRLNACDCFPYPYGYGVDENNNIDLTEAEKIIAVLAEKGIELINITLGNPYLIPHINRPCVNSPEDGNIGLERIYNITKALKKRFPDIKIVSSGLTFPGENAVTYAEKLIDENVCDFAGFGRMTFAYPQFFSDYLEKGELDKNKVCLKCSKCTELMRSGTVTGCPIRDSEVYMPYYKKYVLDK